MNEAIVQDFLANEFFESPCFRQTPSIPGGNWWNEAEEAGESSGAESKSKEVSKSKRMKMERREYGTTARRMGRKKKKKKRRGRRKKEVQSSGMVWPTKIAHCFAGAFPFEHAGGIFACITSPAGSIWFGGLHLGCFCVLVLILVFSLGISSRWNRGSNVGDLCGLAPG